MLNSSLPTGGKTGFAFTSSVEVRCAGKEVPLREVEDSWVTVPPVAWAVFGGWLREWDCEGVPFEGGGASIFMALDSWGCCALGHC
jgi:hypothetical protein